MTDPGSPATPRQKEYARQLGVEFDATVTFGELGNKITAVKQTAPPSEAQIEFAHNLGIEFAPETITAPELRKLLNAAVAKRSRAALNDNPVLKIGETIMYKDNPYRIEEFDRRRWRVKLVPCYKMAKVRTVWVMIITVENATHIDVVPQQPRQVR